MNRLLLALLCLAMLNGCGSGSSTPASGNQTKLLASSSTVPANYSTVVQQLYVSYFGRPADAAGLAFYEGILVSAGAPTTLSQFNAVYGSNASVKTIIDGFGTSAESNALYGTDTNILVNAIYRNLFNRDAEPAGQAFWANLIDTGVYSKGQAALIIMSYAQSTDLTAVNNKVTVAESFTGVLTTPEQSSAYSGLGPNATVRAMLRDVTDTTNATAFQSTVTATIDSLVLSSGTGPVTVSTLAGSGSKGNTNATGTAASFHFPLGGAVDTAGNVYVTDSTNNSIRKVTSAGVVTTLAGTGGSGSANGTGTAASFDYPFGVAVDNEGTVYVTEINNNLIRKITPAGVVTTLAGTGNAGSANGTGTAASFYNPAGIAVDSSGNVYVVDSGNHLIRKITAAGVVTTFAGSGSAGTTDGTGAAASFGTPVGLAMDSAGNLYVADTEDNLIRKITPAGVVTTIAGSGAAGSTNGTGTAASFNAPTALAVDSVGNIFVADRVSSLIRKITQDGVVTTIAGGGLGDNANGVGTDASFRNPYGLAIDSLGNLYVIDTNNELIRKITRGFTGFT